MKSVYRPRKHFRVSVAPLCIAWLYRPPSVKHTLRDTVQHIDLTLFRRRLTTLNALPRIRVTNHMRVFPVEPVHSPHSPAAIIGRNVLILISRSHYRLLYIGNRLDRVNVHSPLRRRSLCRNLFRHRRLLRVVKLWLLLLANKLLEYRLNTRRCLLFFLSILLLCIGGLLRLRSYFLYRLTVNSRLLGVQPVLIERLRHVFELLRVAEYKIDFLLCSRLSLLVSRRLCGIKFIERRTCILPVGLRFHYLLLFAFDYGGLDIRGDTGQETLLPPRMRIPGVHANLRGSLKIPALSRRTRCRLPGKLFLLSRLNEHRKNLLRLLFNRGSRRLRGRSRWRSRLYLCRVHNAACCRLLSHSFHYNPAAAPAIESRIPVSALGLIAEMPCDIPATAVPPRFRPCSMESNVDGEDAIRFAFVSSTLSRVFI